MCKALIIGMLAILALHTGIVENDLYKVLFWTYWVLAIATNTRWWRKIEDKFTKG